jgi:hypothetical protein
MKNPYLQHHLTFGPFFEYILPFFKKTEVRFRNGGYCLLGPFEYKKDSWKINNDDIGSLFYVLFILQSPP